VKKKCYMEFRGNGTSLHNIKLRKDDWIGHILRRNFLLKHFTLGKIEENIDGKTRRGRRRTQLLDNLKKRKRYCKWTEEALDRTPWRTRFGRSCGPIVIQTTR
jgi:hypothetical protein